MDKIRATSRSLSEADEQVDKGPVHIEAIRLGDFKVKRQTYPPGLAVLDRHGAGAVLRHARRVCDLRARARPARTAGEELDIRGGDVFVIPPGHDAWTIGEEDAVMVQFDEGASALERFGVEAPAKAKAA